MQLIIRQRKFRLEEADDARIKTASIAWLSRTAVHSITKNYRGLFQRQMVLEANSPATNQIKTKSSARKIKGIVQEYTDASKWVLFFLKLKLDSLIMNEPIVKMARKTSLSIIPRGPTVRRDHEAERSDVTGANVRVTSRPKIAFRGTLPRHTLFLWK